ncbi:MULTISPECIES: exodeoxyribonuclease V subunit alpha [unclassified Delftia]|uniref:exodeoxyribonuclease V subunit alpha n=1 Tax=unclassified Delftia TaxID=2613839 RepID=UPI001150B253|nr:MULTISPECIES: exodeoxyribonuclease V subunit alpha [unclassified Delftia]MCB4789728.1 exodeoxyribonuclease V subunit alpha [Delftia sp. Lp-1]TQL79857.1 DNA helicase/exodeoxyribonuclease V alpha subunit [Delftia sp. HK171]
MSPRPRLRAVDTATLDLFDERPGGEPPGDDSPGDASLGGKPPGAVPPDTNEVLALLRRWADAGLLRRLDAALASFVAGQDAQAGPALLVAAALLAQMEGRGHSCLPLAPLAGHPNDVLAWPAEALPAQQALWQMLPARLSGWVAALGASPVVRVVGDAGQDGGEDLGQPLVLAGADGPAPLLYLRRYWDYERAVATHVIQRTAAQAVAGQPLDEVLARHWLDRLFPPAAEGGPVDWQKLACALALRGRLSVITGGPGTGKTYTAARLLALLFATAPDAGQLRVALAAPTGKAAARLKQSIDGALLQLQGSMGGEIDLAGLVQRMGAARTLHSMLGARPDTRHWGFHAGRQLDVDVLIVDEASMVHLEMMAALLEALPSGARLVLLGDKDQLASVEAGAVLGDLCRDAQAGRYLPDTLDYALRVAGQAVPPQFAAPAGDRPPALAQHTVMLRESRRFGGPIGQLARAVNAGHAAQAQALLDAGTQGGTHSELWERQGGGVQAVTELAVRGRGGLASYALYARALQNRPAADGDYEAAHRAWVVDVLQAFERFRLLCAVREGDWGVSGLNRAVEQALEAQGAIRRSGEWYAGRPVMVTRNDAQLGVFNGDIGIALPGGSHGGSQGGPQGGPGQPLRVYFLQGDELRSVGVSRLAHVETAFAMTVHKSQGSEFEHTALVLPSRGGSVLGRELVYTGITRARQAFSLFSEVPGLLASAVGSPTQRASGLLRWLQD